MPRPGPRPYECTRRAWHSDSHQPLRGRLIQEIFRVVNELHSNSTRRNKEWQDKLPIVVLRAEEVLYSKANSEDEYMDLKTLPTRLGDAVNTMIRREDDDESGGPYLEPCVEAALSFGCTPKKASRGQRHWPPRLCNSSARRMGAHNLSSSVSSLPGGDQCSHESSSTTLPRLCTGLVMQENGSWSIYCATALPDLIKPDVNQNFVYHASPAPLFSGIDTQDFGLCYPPHAGRLPGFSRERELSESDISITISNRGLPGVLRGAELGHQGRIVPVGCPTTLLPLLPDVNQEGGIMVQSAVIPRTTTDAAGTLCANTQWPHSLFIASSMASSPSSVVPSPEIVAASTSRVYIDPNAHFATTRCKSLEGKLHFSVDTGLQFPIPCPTSYEKQANRTSGTAFPLSSRLARVGGYDEAVCSLTSAPALERSSLVSAVREKESATSRMEMHDLQLRLGPPGGVNKVTPFDDHSRVNKVSLF
eukprot:c21251_g1_i8 orf=423-1850(-)